MSTTFYDNPRIIDIAVMPNGKVVICDFGNDKLELFSNKLVCDESLKLRFIWCVSVVDPSTVIVTVPKKKKLHYVQLLPRLKLRRNIQLDSECLGACVSGNDINVTCKTSTGREIRVMSLDGTLKRLVPIEKKSSPWEIWEENLFH